MNVLATAGRADIQRIERTSDRHHNWCDDRELIGEVAEALLYVGDIQYGTIISNPFRNQVQGKLQDGRIMRVTVTFE